MYIYFKIYLAGIKKSWTQPSGRVAGRGGPAQGRGAQASAGQGRGGQGGADLASGGAGRGSRAKGVLDKGRPRPRLRKVDRAPSLVVRGDWVVVEEFDLAQLTKLIANKPVIEDLSWFGHLDQYDDSYDKVSTRAPRPLRRVENKVFYGVTTTEDPIVEKYAVDGVGNVFATDAILSHLMACPRSVYSWDIVVQKVDGVLFFDKRADSQFDLLTVSETANEPPSNSEDVDEINWPDKLSVEATTLNQNFSQQILRDSGVGRKAVIFHSEFNVISTVTIFFF
jgi:translation initiation factor 3 subunit D